MPASAAISGHAGASSVRAARRIGGRTEPRHGFLRGPSADGWGRTVYGAYRDRTGDPQLAKLVLSQLS